MTTNCGDKDYDGNDVIWEQMMLPTNHVTEMDDYKHVDEILV